ncbi:hypothetical protein, partial [Pseudotabrizicola sediminis]|uniref:hypothetical protein n=1 Tax=Pseudotabrizicola sediminis TaxID=2486418 RepID=UPI0010818751
MPQKKYSLRIKFIRRLKHLFPGWAKMAEFKVRQNSDGNDLAEGSWCKDRVVIKIGKEAFFIKSRLVNKAPALWDFALFGL